uniref:F-box domain-containing protein n=1 Tax=Caenorhabditis tropicalis TaxID=1561998 RepID=A0A1I7TAS2_9PELO
MILEMRKPEPIWQDLPEKFKNNVIKYLDYSSRCQLRLCSHSDKETVDKCALVLKTVTMETQTNFNVHTVIKVLKTREIFRITCDFFRAPEILGKIFSNPSMSVRVLSVEYVLIPEVILSFKRHNVSKVKLQSVHIKRSWKAAEQYGVRDSCLDFLEYFDLKTMIIDGRCQGKYFDRLIQMDQWKNCRGVYFPTRNEFTIDHFFHFNSLRLSLKTLSSDDAKRLIENFTNKETVEHETTFFQISTEQPMIPEDILSTNDMDLKKKLTHHNEGDGKMLAGSVCRTNEYTEEDFMNSPLI